MNREKSIKLLNKAVGEELLAIDQYMYFHFICDDRGFAPLAGIFKRLAIVEMIHAEKLAERILFLKGEVEMGISGQVEKIHEVKQMLEKAEAMEAETVKNYNIWARECAEALDSATKSVFEGLILEEENHQANFDTEMDNLNKFGDNYLALQSIERSKSVAVGTKTE